jgi:hypothetical protein
MGKPYHRKLLIFLNNGDVYKKGRFKIQTITIAFIKDSMETKKKQEIWCYLSIQWTI